MHIFSRMRDEFGAARSRTTSDALKGSCRHYFRGKQNAWMTFPPILSVNRLYWLRRGGIRQEDAIIGGLTVLNANFSDAAGKGQSDIHFESGQIT